MTTTPDDQPFLDVDPRVLAFWGIGIFVGVWAGQAVFGASLWRTIFAVISAVIILFGYKTVKNLR